ncbi:MAG: hypothetical protein C0409_12555 [Novosphingobium sp.]|nr:hypothetical protein [Novosphingobium sp.]
MKSTFDLMRVWAMLTGIVLTAGYFASVYAGVAVSEMLPNLVSAIGGFELFLFTQDLWIKRRQPNG